MKMYAFWVGGLAAFLFVLVLSVGPVSAQEPVPSVVTSAAKVPVRIIVSIPDDALGTGTSTVITVALDIVSTTTLSGTEIVSSELLIDAEAIAGNIIASVEIGEIEVSGTLEPNEGEGEDEPTDAMPVTVQGTALHDANLRAGPGTAYDIVGNVQQGDELTIVGQNELKDWYLLVSDKWIAAFLVDSLHNTFPTVEYEGILAIEQQAASDFVGSSTTEPLTSGKPVQYHSEEPRCDVYVLRQAGEEPPYVGVEGYIKGVLPGGYGDHIYSLPETPWFARILVQTGPDKWEPGESTILAKTPVVVTEQHLKHRSHGNYFGRFVVKSLVDNQQYVISAGSFTLADYWRCPAHQAIKRSSFIATVKDGVQIVDKDGRWQELGPQRQVYCDDRPISQPDFGVVDAIYCMVYKVYDDGYRGKTHIIPSAGLEIGY